MKKAITVITITIILTCLCGCSSMEDISALDERISTIENEVATLESRVDFLEKTAEPTIAPTSTAEPTVAPTATPEPSLIPLNEEKWEVLFEGKHVDVYPTRTEAENHPEHAVRRYETRAYHFIVSGITLNKVVVTGESVQDDGITYFSGRSELDWTHTGDNVYTFEHRIIPLVSDRTFEIISANGSSRFFYLAFEK